MGRTILGVAGVGHDVVAGRVFHSLEPSRVGRVEYPLKRLQKKWDLQTPVLYIGKAGGIHGGTSLWERLHLYRRYGAGENATHRGGRAIWQVQDAVNQLLLCWADTPSLDPGCVEEQLLRFFEATYGMLPLANQAHGKKCQHRPLCSWPSATAAELA